MSDKVTFVNGVLGGGILNGVVNLQLGVCLFDHVDDKGQVLANLTPAAYLRMDLLCAQTVRDYLNDILTKVEPTTRAGANGLGAAETGLGAAEEPTKDEEPQLKLN